MPRITPVKWKILECIFLKAGFVFERQMGSHRTYSRSDIDRPVVIPRHNKDIDVAIIKSNMKTANLSREDYFKYLNECK